MTGSARKRHEVLRVGDLELDPRGWSVASSGRGIHVTPTEFRLLEVMMRSPGVVFERRELLGHLQRRCTNPRMIDVYVARLRTRFLEQTAEPSPIHSIRVVGYVLRVAGVNEQRCRICAMVDALSDEHLDRAERILRRLSQRSSNTRNWPGAIATLTCPS
jgi:DNA-binding winged helix-turn-helix (wHTH) protein